MNSNPKKCPYCSSNFMCDACFQQSTNQKQQKPKPKPKSKTLSGIQGPQGPEGAAGLDGLDGIQGPPGQIGGQFETNYNILNVPQFVFTPSFQTPSSYTDFNEISINNTIIKLNPTLNFENLNQHLETHFGIIHQPSLSTPYETDTYTVPNPIEEFTISPTTYIDPQSTPENHLTPTKNENMLQILVKTKSGDLGSIDFESFVDHIANRIIEKQHNK